MGASGHFDLKRRKYRSISRGRTDDADDDEIGYQQEISRLLSYTDLMRAVAN